MRYRCNDKTRPDYERYGGRGITVCDEWKDEFKPFYEWSMSHGYRKDLTIDRIDNDGPYSPENCRWATIKEQCRNRRTNINITIGDKTKTLVEWCEIFDVTYKNVYQRYRKNPNRPIEELFAKSLINKKS